MNLKEAKEDLRTLRNWFKGQEGNTYPAVLKYCYFLLTAIEYNDKKLMEKLMKGEDI